MVLNLKIEILKVFSLEFNFTSEKKKKEIGNVQESSGDKSAVDHKPSSSK
jgi:hypothetical protein